MDNFPGKYNFVWLTQKEIANLHRPKTNKENLSAIKKLPTDKTKRSLDGFNGDFYKY